MDKLQRRELQSGGGSYTDDFDMQYYMGTEPKDTNEVASQANGTYAIKAYDPNATQEYAEQYAEELTIDIDATKNGQNIYKNKISENSLRASIDKGEPLALHITGHFMVGVGYINTVNGMVIVYNDPAGVKLAEYISDSTVDEYYN